MTFEKFLKALMAGMLFPAVLMTLVYTVVYGMGSKAMHHHPMQFMPLWIPLLFGLVNSVYCGVQHKKKGNKTKAKEKKDNRGLWITGIVLGLVVALFGVFVFHLPTLLFGFKGGIKYLPIIVAPIVYGVIFRYIVKPLNSILGI